MLPIVYFKLGLSFYLFGDFLHNLWRHQKWPTQGFDNQQNKLQWGDQPPIRADSMMSRGSKSSLRGECGLVEVKSKVSNHNFKNRHGEGVSIGSRGHLPLLLLPVYLFLGPLPKPNGTEMASISNIMRIGLLFFCHLKILLCINTTIDWMTHCSNIFVCPNGDQDTWLCTPVKFCVSLTYLLDTLC